MMAAATGEMQQTIEGRLTESLSPVHLEVINESDMHAGPAKESHFKVRIKRVLGLTFLTDLECYLCDR